ncbi:hypothetical protein Vadar_016376 [Vaccinium darrowii]|uniref:Uncharacterized protein n=1 Tax=Vaccinium darrowii TaxID=229202 RepID=A0ACB7X161_9ERIC|nr:hypothetical protein Vadar_016376 [Vaccinium darrowii]
MSDMVYPAVLLFVIVATWYILPHLFLLFVVLSMCIELTGFSFRLLCGGFENLGDFLVGFKGLVSVWRIGFGLTLRSAESAPSSWEFVWLDLVGIKVEPSSVVLNLLILIVVTGIGNAKFSGTMALPLEELNIDGEVEGEERTPLKESRLYRTSFPGAVRKRAYIFDGEGNYYNKDWDLIEGRGNEFCWYHVELPKGTQNLSQSAQYLIDVLCPPLKLQDILSLVSNGPFCGHVDGALVFRVNSPGTASGKFTFRIAARVTENSVITVSLGRVPRLGFSPVGESLLSEIPSVENPNHVRGEKEKGGIVIREHVLEFLLTMNHTEEADNPVPKSVSKLVIHIIDTHVDHIQDIVTKLEIDLDAVEFELDRGGFALKKQMLDDRRFPKMHLDLQRLLQVIAHGEQVFPRVKEKCASKHWFSNEDINSLEELIGRLRRLKENVGFIANRVTAIQAGLDSWQAEQINRKLYYLSFLSIIFLPLSIVTGVFGMNVGGVPWTEQRDPKLKDGFRNVILLCVAMLLFVLLCFIVPAIYARVAAWRRKRDVRRSWSLNRKSILRKTLGGEDRGGYLRL